jgi:hypothetical protein
MRARLLLLVLLLLASLLVPASPGGALAPAANVTLGGVSTDEVAILLNSAQAPPTGPISDPQGDTFGAGAVQLDLSSIDAVYASALTVTVEFYTPIEPASAGAANSVSGFVDMDTDQNAATGFPEDNMGLEFFVDISSEQGGNVDVVSIDAGGGQMPAGSAPISFTSTSFTIVVPLAVINDDGMLNYDVFAGTVDEGTDIAPNLPPGTSRALDTDGDGLPDSSDPDDDGDSNLPPGYTECKGPCPGGYWRDVVEMSVGTNPLDRCADTPTANDEADDKWPPDFDDNRSVNVVDFTLWKVDYPSPPKPLNARADLNASGSVNVLDFGAWRPYFGTACAP